MNGSFCSLKRRLVNSGAAAGFESMDGERFPPNNAGFAMHARDRARGLANFFPDPLR